MSFLCMRIPPSDLKYFQLDLSSGIIVYKRASYFGEGLFALIVSETLKVRQILILLFNYYYKVTKNLEWAL